MFKIMLVDDEKIVRQCLRETIEWKRYDCEIVCEAADAAEAVDLYEKFTPDIIITDIVMSEMNGIEFIEKVRKTDKNIEFIILTGYENFDYAKSALENNVSSYILKPFKNEIIIDAILKAKEKINSRLQTVVYKKAHLDQNKNSFLLGLMSYESITAPELSELAAKYGIFIPCDRYVVALMQIDKSDNMADDINTSTIYLAEAISYNLSTTDIYALPCRINSYNQLLLIFYQENTSINSITALLRNVQRQYTTNSGSTLTIGVSNIFKNLVIFKRAYRQASTAVSHKAVYGKNSIIHFIDIPQVDEPLIVLSDDEIDKIVNEIKKQHYSQALNDINQYFAKLKNLKSPNIPLIKNNILELSILILRSIVRNTPLMNSIFGRNVLPAAELQKLEVIDDIRQWITDIITSIANNPQTCLPYSYSPIICQAILFIMTNYPSHISIDQLAKKLYTSPRTLMRLFKSETDKTFVEYLTNYRMEMAVKLLQTTNYKTNEISVLVGYDDPKYFYKTFKRITGNNPKQYRNKA